MGKNILIKISIVLISVIISIGVFSGCSKPENTPPPEDIINGDFETGSLEGWEILYGKAFADKGVKQDEIQNKQGNFYYGDNGSEKIGKMRSNTFVCKGYVSVLLGGGQNIGLNYLSIFDNESKMEIFRCANNQFTTQNQLNKYVIDVLDYKNKDIYIEITDDSTTENGCLFVDDICNLSTKPELTNCFVAQDIKPKYNPSYADYNMPNSDFSVGLKGWSILGDGFNAMHISNGKLNNRISETEVGVLYSPCFTVNNTGIISFRLGGMKNFDRCYVSVRQAGTNKELYRVVNSRRKDTDEENTHIYYVDLSKHLGEVCYLEIVDNSKSDWGLVIIHDIVTSYESIPKITDEASFNVSPVCFTKYRDFNNLRTLIIPQILQLSTINNARQIFNNCFFATLDGVEGLYNSVMQYNSDGTTFILTGDIPAMWLRDSSAQVVQYLPFLKHDTELKSMIKGLIHLQLEYIRMDGYANAFYNNGAIHERKFEIDSLCYPIWLAFNYYKQTGDTSIINQFFLQSCESIINVFKNEQNHNDANYDIASVSISDKNKYPNEVKTNIGLIWNGYRPSDDVCKYKYLVPSNMFASVILEQMSDMLDAVGIGKDISLQAKQMSRDIRLAIDKYAVVNVAGIGKVYAYEVNGLGENNPNWNGQSAQPYGYNLMDDANIPSLLSMPWLGYCEKDDPIYLNTRKFILSDKNKYYFQGTDEKFNIFKGIGSEHTAQGNIWHMGLAMQAMTSLDESEIKQCLDMLLLSTGNKYVMHESFDATNPNRYTRDWFTWPCSLYSQAVMSSVMGYEF